MRAMDTGAAVEGERPVVASVEVLPRVAAGGGAALGLESSAGWRNYAFVKIVHLSARGASCYFEWAAWCTVVARIVMSDK